MSLEIVPVSHEFNIVLGDFWNRDVESRELSSKMLGKAASFQECIKKVEATLTVVFSRPPKGKARDFFCKAIIAIERIKTQFTVPFNEFMSSIKEMNDYCDNVIRGADRLATKTDAINAKNYLNALRERVSLISCKNMVSLNYTSFIIRNYIVRVS